VAGGRDRHHAALLGGGYASLVADRLVELRQAGMKTFSIAFSYAVDEHPPPWPWTHSYLPGEPSALETLRRALEAEWNGAGSGGRLARPPLDDDD
jgi:hypothetical protein